MTAQGRACCSSPSSVFYWCSVSLLAWGALSIVGIYWHPLHSSSAVTICLAVAISCAANWLRNRTLHCAITGPIFLVAGGSFLLSDMHVLPVDSRLVWPIVAIGTGIAFSLEWLYASRGENSGKMNPRIPS